jgi:cation transport regulator ChaC
MQAGLDDPIWYFGYGSNMSPATFLERRQMRPLQTRWGWLDGYRLSFNIPVGSCERGVANLEADDKGRTCGVLYLLPPAECDRLDGTEGVSVGLYRRIVVAVAAGEQRVTAFTYQSSLTQAGRKPSARYMGLLLEGARHHGLPAAYIDYLESFELAWDEREGQRR